MFTFHGGNPRCVPLIQCIFPLLVLARKVFLHNDIDFYIFLHSKSFLCILRLIPMTYNHSESLCDDFIVCSLVVYFGVHSLEISVNGCTGITCIEDNLPGYW